MENEFARLELLFLGRAGFVVERLGKACGELENSSAGAAEGVALLTEEDIVILPVLGDAKALMKTTVLVCLCKQPGRVHEILAWQGRDARSNLSVSKRQIRGSEIFGCTLTTEEFGNFLVPKGDISFAIIDDGPERGGANKNKNQL